MFVRVVGVVESAHRCEATPTDGPDREKSHCSLRQAGAGTASVTRRRLVVSLLDHVLIPVASEEDATATCAALGPHLDGIDRLTAIHVIEKGGGAIDKAPMEKRRADGAEFLAIVESRLGESVAVDTGIEFGTDVVETIFDEAAAAGVTVIAFRPRGGSRILRLLTGGTATRLVTDPEVPVVALPDQTDD